MQDYFYALAELIQSLLQGEEVFTCAFHGEASDFVRFNHDRIRQAGHVIQQSITLDLIAGRRHAAADLTLAGEPAVDRIRLTDLIQQLRAIRAHVPEDPFLYYATEVHSSERCYPDTLPAGQAMAETLLAAGQGHDLVGILASGAIHAGFANALGQRNWYSRHSFNLDWSLYLRADKAVKARYAGFDWRDEELRTRMETAAGQLAVMARPARQVPPSRYRVYLTPVALEEIVGLLSWDAFSLRAHRTGATPLLKMVEEGARLHPALTLRENTAEGIAADFQSAGFIRPPQVSLIEQGVYRDCLVSPRSAAEYGVPTNGAGAEEDPVSLDLAAGAIPANEVLERLDTGLYIGNLWYLNYSDRNAARMTGMTRFATFWVENGRIQAPMAVLRFDETLYHLLGDRLLGLTAEKELLLDPGSYGSRSTRSARLPGALVEEMTFTL
ncbi:MAG: metallopeptidase TldD-related protein [Candidatus Competibacteraceae bacterium]